MTEIARLLAVATVFIGFNMDSNVYILRGGGGDKTTYAGT